MKKNTGALEKINNFFQYKKTFLCSKCTYKKIDKIVSLMKELKFEKFSKSSFLTIWYQLFYK